MKTNIKLVNVIVDLGKATNLTLGGFGEYMEFGFHPLQLFTSKKDIIEFSIASQVTQGSELGWWEWNRPSHPKNGR
jgi:hypothetical protein